MKSSTVFLGSLLVAVCVLRLDAGQSGEGPSVNTLPPVVIKTTPVSGNTHVDAARTKEIRVTFSKRMMDGNYSFVQISDATMPKSTGTVYFAHDGKTCILPVALKPGRTYVLWINSNKYGNFKDRAGHSAVPYLLVFETKAAK